MDTGMRDGAMPHVRRRVALALTVVLGAAFLMPATSSFGATGTVSVVDYSQCANGTGTDLDCHVQGWINGIMQKSNSHFQEGDVTPQRAIVTVTGAGPHSIRLRYQARKGTTHAYDSLATWNHTVKDADRCLGLTAAVQTAINCPSTSQNLPTLSITPDPTVVAPFTSATGITSDHDIDGQEIQLFSASASAHLTSMSTYSHDHASCPGKCADDYATVTLNFTAPTGSTVEILFGGHLGVSPINRGGWGPGLGASNINGGPYHIKWDAADGGSVGNRDNQITGGDIQALAEPGLSTSASPATATIGTAVVLTDTATLAGATDPSGAMTFKLWGPYATSADATCGDPIAAPSEVPVNVGTITNSAYVKNPVGTGTGNWSTTGTAASYTFPADSDGLYYWTAQFAADGNNTSAGPEGCADAAESVTVSKATPTGDTTVVIDDNATVTGDGTNVPGGTVTFLLYDNDSSCGVTDPAVLPVFDSGAVAVTADGTNAVASASAAYETTPSHTYYWKVTYSGDGIYNGATLSDCVESAAIT